MFRNRSLVVRLTLCFLIAGLMCGISSTPASSAAKPAGITPGDQDVVPADNVISMELAVDDNSFEDAIGLVFGGTLGAVNRLTPPSYPATLTDVKIFFRPGTNVFVGDALTILASSNPGGGDDVSFLVYATMDATIQAIGQFNTYDVPDITINSGDFVVGFGITHRSGAFPIALDSTTPFHHRSYVATRGLPYTHVENAGLTLVGNFGIRAKVNLTQTCTYTLTPSSQAFEKPGGSGSFNVNTSLGDCSWTASTAASWITITSGSGTGNGTVSYNVAANSGAARSASISVAGQVYAVTQAGLPVPAITSVIVQGKKLLVSGRDFDVGAQILLNGSVVKKVSNDETSPTTLLVARKAGRDLAPGMTVTIQVRNASGLLSSEFSFTRP